MVATRLVNMAVGLVSIPVLIRYLGGNTFAAWALLLALSAAFSLLELGMSSIVVRFVALPASNRDWGEGRLLIGRVWVLLILSFGLGLLVTLQAARPLASWLGLPATQLMSPEGTVYAVYGAVMARAFLKSGLLSLFAARRFGAVAAISLLQPLCSNLAAMAAALQFGRLDYALIAFWSAQLAVLGITCVLTRHMSLPAMDRHTLNLARLWELALYGVATQMDGWAQFINFQFDKFIVAGLVGLWGVAPYEVANRAVMALRSIPASGAETFLPTAMTQRVTQSEAWAWYEGSTRLIAYALLLFIVAPLAIAPVFLYAWTGEMGYVGRWVFIALAIGSAADVLAIPAATMAQAEGRPAMQGRAALLSIAMNIPLSLMLVLHWGITGAAVGTALAMLGGAAQLIVAVHRHFGRPVVPTLRSLAAFWPPVLVCVCWAAVTYLVFGAWFEALDPLLRFSRVTRAYPGVAALAVYAMCLVSMLLVEVRRGAFSLAERRFLARALKLERFGFGRTR